jgi:hypothetical protein
MPYFYHKNGPVDISSRGRFALFNQGFSTSSALDNTHVRPQQFIDQLIDSNLLLLG